MATPEAPQYTGHARGAPRGDGRVRPWPWRVLQLLDERDSSGGRAKAALFLLHPGPSLLVTAVTVGAAGFALHAAPGVGLALRLVLLMLPAQFAIGAANDLADLRVDGDAKPYKPLVRGAVAPRWALCVVVLGAALSLGSAASFGPAVLGATVAGLGAGLAYDAGLKRGRWSWVPWWVAFTALPLCAYTAAGRFVVSLWWTVPLSLLLALALHCANALPDIDADRRAGLRSLPVWLGPTRARAFSFGGMLATAAATAALAGALHQSGPWLPAAWGVVLLAVAAGVVAPRLRRAPFPLLALAGATLGVAWLAALPAAP